MKYGHVTSLSPYTVLSGTAFGPYLYCQIPTDECAGSVSRVTVVRTPPSTPPPPVLSPAPSLLHAFDPSTEPHAISCLSFHSCVSVTISVVFLCRCNLHARMIPQSFRGECPGVHRPQGTHRKRIAQAQASGFDFGVSFLHSKKG